MVSKEAYVSEKNSTYHLILDMGDEHLEIILTEDKPQELKQVFNNLIKKLKSGLFNFNFKNNRMGLYDDICQEYIKHLNEELKQVYKTLEENSLLNE